MILSDKELASLQQNPLSQRVMGTGRLKLSEVRSNTYFITKTKKKKGKK